MPFPAVPDPVGALSLFRTAQALQHPRLGAEGTSPPPIAPPMGFEGDLFGWLDSWLEIIGQELRGAISALPELPGALADAVERSAAANGGANAIALAGVSIVLGVSLLVMFRTWTGTTREGGLDEVGCRTGASRLLVWDVIDRLVFAALLIALGRMFVTGWGVETSLATAALRSAIRWYAIMLIAQVVLRPRRPRYRLLPVTGLVARKVMALVGAVVGLSVIGPTVLPVLVRNGMPWPPTMALALVLLTMAGLLAALGVQLAANGLVRVIGAAGRNLVALVGTVLAVGFHVLWAISILLRQFGVFTAVLSTIGLVGAFAMIDATLGLEAGREAGSRARIVRRIVRIGALFLMPDLLGEIWFGRSGAMPAEFWSSVRLAILYGGGTAFAGYVAWVLTDFWAERAIGQTPRIDPLNATDDDSDKAPASRLATFFPMARVLMAIMITLLAGLLALSNLGVNIAPLLAGAGVFGLAISFGSQSLIRDILSGVFFLGDDAFRVGEYIDTGRLKGTVEQISLRSLRLRHQNGQVHTIPYGQLQAITNFSRDWATMKFNLRIDPDVDLEHVRKTVKKVGLAMLEDPELGRELIQPVKLQGVADIQDNALIIRIKFTARPGRPTWVQREALKRIHMAFREQGISFASNAVTVRDVEHGPYVPAALPSPRPGGSNPVLGAAAATGIAATTAAVAAERS
jgi:moderate conductance mechanosensitive channel